jgi:MarR family 2-MHQ and catechol resistance regulon transcriptional repressor
MNTGDHTLALYHGLQQVYVLLDDGDRRALRTVGLTPTQYNLLRQVYARDGTTITELSQVLLCTRGNITRLVQRLAQQGLVRCGGDERDQRLVRVSLTSQGSLRLEDARVVYEAAIRRRLGVLDPASQQQLHSLIDTLIAALTADLAAQPAIPVEAGVAES